MPISCEDQKLNLALSLIINSGETDKPDKKSTIKTDIYTSLNNSKATAGKFSICWGPAIFRADKKYHDKRYDHVLMIVQNCTDSSDYRLVIRGTWSNINAFNEDLNVLETVDWLKWDPKAPNNAKISKGTDKALNYILNQVKYNPTDTGPEESIIDAIDKIAQQKGIQNITVIGHSLGGVMASTLGLYLKRHYINNKNIRIHACTFAGPTAGNDIFASYSDSFFKGTLDSDSYESNFLRIHNINDIVPLAWAKNDLKTIEKLYPNLEVIIGVKIYIHKTRHIHYTQLSPEFSFPEKLDKHLHFPESIMDQHIKAYPHCYNMSYKEFKCNSNVPDNYDIVVVDSDLSKHIPDCCTSLIKDVSNMT
ncbi:Lipase (class 3) [Photorhabdus australis subsp. thailandensis]|uniref:Lipase (Class 3) n=1 Tax=Photorhabdus australis subsp. thailandensis TaxID=2805096 RepID=A0A1C0U1P4_9GAMM|nr:lipase family protein [Photorhabdus australis]OCQ51842.1 Lipase (class 3) [Photorhabdus australis subsp. thailandensis]